MSSVQFNFLTPATFFVPGRILTLSYLQLRFMQTPQFRGFAMPFPTKTVMGAQEGTSLEHLARCRGFGVLFVSVHATIAERRLISPDLNQSQVVL